MEGGVGGPFWTLGRTGGRGAKFSVDHPLWYVYLPMILNSRSISKTRKPQWLVVNSASEHDYPKLASMLLEVGYQSRQLEEILFQSFKVVKAYFGNWPVPLGASFHIYETMDPT